MDPTQAVASFRAYPSALVEDPPRAAGGQSVSPWSSPWASGKSLLWCLKQLLPLIFSLTVVSAGLFLTLFFPLTLHCLCSVLLCLKFAFCEALLSWLRVSAVPWGWLVLWSQLEPAFWRGTVPASPHRGHLFSHLLPTPCHGHSIHTGNIILTIFNEYIKIYIFRKRYPSMATNKRNKRMILNYFKGYR